MGGTRISVLAAKAGVSRQAMGVTVREVEALGYIALTPDPSDARATLVTLTDLGVDFCVKGSAASAEVNGELEAVLGVAAAERLRGQLRSVIGSDLGPRGG
jgi:DNA-binding MarR family transcriptional regulator